jgi:hypothetical protein
MAFFWAMKYQISDLLCYMKISTNSLYGKVIQTLGATISEDDTKESRLYVGGNHIIIFIYYLLMVDTSNLIFLEKDNTMKLQKEEQLAMFEKFSESFSTLLI